MKKTFWQWVVYILLYIWQLPQNLVALCLILFFKISKKPLEFTTYKGIIYVWVSKWRNGVSLGNYVLLDNELYRMDGVTINHEYGHTVQSRILGPLYLFTIGILSGGWNLIDRILGRYDKKWTYKRSYKIYYSMPWEHWADVAGGVERHYDQ